MQNNLPANFDHTFAIVDKINLFFKISLQLYSHDIYSLRQNRIYKILAISHNLHKCMI